MANGYRIVVQVKKPEQMDVMRHRANVITERIYGTHYHSDISGRRTFGFVVPDPPNGKTFAEYYVELQEHLGGGPEKRVDFKLKFEPIKI